MSLPTLPFRRVPLPDPVPVRTAEDERADVLAYLAHARAFPFTYATSTADVIDSLRELVEQGQHVGWAKKREP